MRHRMAAFSALALLLVVQLFLGLRMGYKENVADFLPQDEEGGRYLSVYEKLGDQGTVTAIIESKAEDDAEAHYAVIDAVDIFEHLCDSIAACEGESLTLRCHVDEAAALEAMSYIRSHIAIFLTSDDYRRIDSLLAIDGYIDSSLVGVQRLMSFPMGQVAMSTVASDPLNLFSPALQRLELLGSSSSFEIDEEVLFDSCGRGYAFIDSPYGGSDTKGGARVAEVLRKASEETMRRVGSVNITCVGAPLIAVGNANQIKKDSLLAMSISVVLIVIILFVALRRKRNILLLAFSVVVGWLFALAAISLLSTTVSIIVIGIGSVLVGIAVNYPLHFLEHFESHPNRRETLKEMVEPLVTGNITTVSAFACLVFMDSDAMRDLGLFGALMLMGTILFVMVFLPLMVDSKRKVQEEIPEEHLECHGGERLPMSLRLALFVAVVALSVFLGVRSMNPSFDSELHNINYITQEQQDGLDYLNSLLNDTVHEIEYVVSRGNTLDEALGSQESLLSGNKGFRSRGLVGIVPSVACQHESLEQWEIFCQNHPSLATDLKRKSQYYGFSSEAFAPFKEIMSKDYEVVAPDEMMPLISLGDNYLLDDDSSDKESVLVSMIPVPVDSSEFYKAMLRDAAGDGEVLVFDINDIGNNLVNTLNLDFNYILYICGFVVFFFLWISFGRIELALLAFLPLAVAWIWILGIMDLASVKFNIVNIILATFIFGQGDDYTIFITEGLIYENAYGRRRLKSYRRSVIVSALLMFVGIGSLIIAKHPAMRSLAEVAIIGMAVVVLMACYLPPIVFRWLTEKGEQKRFVPLTLLRLVRTFFVFLVFVVFVFFIITPYTYIYRLIGRDSQRKRLRFHRMIHYFISLAVRHIPGVNFRYDNSVGESFERPAIIVPNHLSHLDLLCVMQMTPKLVILTGDWVWHNPTYGAIIRYAEYYPVSDGYELLLPKLKSLVDRGYSIVVFPEGTRSMDGEIGRFHKGAFQLAQQLGVELLPVLIHGAYHVMPKKDNVLRPGNLTVKVLQRVAAPADKDSRTLSSEMHAFMQVQYSELRQQLEDEAYCLPLVKFQYIYKGREVARRARRNLKNYIDNGKDTVGQGETAILKAMAHRDQQFECLFDIEDDYLVASTIVNRLDIKNLTLILET